MVEQEKYQKCWDIPAYRNFSPGENVVDLFKEIAKPRPTDAITDYGCGTGRAALALSKLCTVKALDFSDNCLDFNVRQSLNDRLQFQIQDLTKPIQGITRLGFCTDVMEHIPTDLVDTVLKNITQSCRHCFFQISCEPDNMGALIGEQLHLTVKPYSWWLDKFKEVGCMVQWSHDFEHACAFYVTAWVTGQAAKERCGVNTEDTVLIEQIAENLKLGLPEVTPQIEQEGELIILAGGPSLNDFVDEIKLNKRMGIPIVTVNGAYNWALERGIKPDAQIVLDAREFNKRFVEPSVDTCKYLIASQCHPELVKRLPKEQSYLWHSGKDNVEQAMQQVHGEDNHVWFPVFGGMTVMLRAIPPLIMMGYRKFVIYGFDSCLMNNDHHAYSQPENDYVNTVDITCGDKTFTCHGWQYTQAYEWLEMQQMIGDLCEIEVKGDGLIAQTIKHGYQLAMDDAA